MDSPQEGGKTGKKEEWRMTFLAQEQGVNGAALAMGCGVPQTQGISPMGGSQPSQYPPSTPKDLGPWRDRGWL